MKTAKQHNSELVGHVEIRQNQKANPWDKFNPSVKRNLEDSIRTLRMCRTEQAQTIAELRTKLASKDAALRVAKSALDKWAFLITKLKTDYENNSLDVLELIDQTKDQSSQALQAINKELGK